MKQDAPRCPLGDGGTDGQTSSRRAQQQPPLGAREEGEVSGPTPDLPNLKQVARAQPSASQSPSDLDAGDHSRTTTSTCPTVAAREHGLGSPPAPPGSAPHRPNQNPWGENRYRLHFKFPRGLRRSTESAGPCARAPLAQGNCHLGPIQNTRFLTRPGDLSAQAPSRGVAARPARGPTPARPAVPSPRSARRAIGEKLPPLPRRGSLCPHVPCHTRPCQCVCFQTPSVPSQNRGTRRPLPGPPAPAVTGVRAVSTDLSVG